jgi:hypothetical protein
LTATIGPARPDSACRLRRAHAALDARHEREHPELEVEARACQEDADLLVGQDHALLADLAYRGHRDLGDVSIWRRNQEGAWRVLLDTGSADPKHP